MRPLTGHAARLLFRFQVRLQIRDGFFHHARALHHLRQKHAPRSEEVADHVHRAHQRAFDDRERLAVFLPRLFRVFLDVIRDALHERVRQPLLQGATPPRVFFHCSLLFCLYGFRERQQTFGGVGTPVEQYVLDQIQQVLGNLFVDRELAGVHDGHVQAGLNRAIQKRGVHRFAHHVLAAERKRNVADAAAHFRIRKLGLDLPRGFDEIDGVIVVLFDARRHGQNIRIKNNFFRSNAGLFRENPIGSGAHFHLARQRIRLALLIERHHHHRRAVPPDQARALPEGLFAFLQADGIHDAPALDALQAGLDDFPVGAVNHDWHAGDVRLRGNVVQKRGHGLLGIEHGFVHVDVDNLRAVFDLLPRHGKRCFEFAGEDQLGKFGRAGDVGALADVDEARIRPQHQRLEPAETGIALRLRENVRRESAHGLGNRTDVRGCRSAAAAGDVQPAVRCKIAQIGGHRFRRLVKSAERVGKACIRVATDVDGREMRKLLDVRAHLLRAEGAVDAHAQQIHVRNGNPERLDRLTGKRAAALVGDGDGNHDRHAPPGGCKIFVVVLADGEERGFGVQRVEDRFQQQKIGAAFDEAARLFVVHLAQFVEGDGARGGAVHILRHRGRAVGRPERSRDEAVLTGMRGFVFVGHRARDFRARDVEFMNVFFEAVIERGNSIGVKRVGLDDVGAGLEILPLNGLHDARLRQIQHVKVSTQVARVLQKLRAAKRRLLQLLRLDHRAHGAVQNDDPLLQEILQRGDSCFSAIQRASPMCKAAAELGRQRYCVPHSSKECTKCLSCSLPERALWPTDILAS